MLYLKAIHIIFVVAWFAGLFYIFRLFIYHTEAQKKPEPERTILSNQFKLMMKRLWYGITWPSAIITLILGTSLTTIMGFWAMPFMHIKLTFVLLLFIYQGFGQYIFNQLKKDKFPFTHQTLRVYNEVAFVLLAAIVFIIVFKNNLNWLYGFFGLIAFAAVLFAGIVAYKRARQRQDKS